MKKILIIISLIVFGSITFINVRNLNSNNSATTIKLADLLNEANAQCESLGDDCWSDAEDHNYVIVECVYYDFGGWFEWALQTTWGNDCYPGSSVCCEWSNSEISGNC